MKSPSARHRADPGPIRRTVPHVRPWRPQPDWVELALSLALAAYAFALLFRSARRDYPIVMLSAVSGYLISRLAGAAWGAGRVFSCRRW